MCEKQAGQREVPWIGSVLKVAEALSSRIVCPGGARWTGRTARAGGAGRTGGTGFTFRPRRPGRAAVGDHRTLGFVADLERADAARRQLDNVVAETAAAIGGHAIAVVEHDR
jgi:hypothetical protein